MGFTEMWHGEPTGFVEFVKSGRKWHSIRWGNRWREGLTIHMATGVRTKRYSCFAEVPVLHVQGIKIIPAKVPGELPRVMVERGPNKVLQVLSSLELLSITINDGFDSPYLLNQWIAELCKAHRTDTLRGQVVMWRPFNYMYDCPFSKPY